MINSSPIGFFDSGVGGLSVYAKFRKELPFENTIYFGDLKNLPYRDKSQVELIGFARNILNFFETKNVKAVIIACNTSSALAYETIKNEYNFEIYPIIQCCAEVISSLNHSKIGVFATQGTVNSGAYKKELQKFNSKIEVKEIACPNWVSIVENVNSKDIDTTQDIKQHIEEMLQFTPQKIILGCTHYPYLLKDLTKYAPEELFIDPAEIFVEYIKTHINLNNSTNNVGKEDFYVSANPELFVKNAQLFYNIKTLPEVI